MRRISRPSSWKDEKKEELRGVRCGVVLVWKWSGLARRVWTLQCPWLKVLRLACDGDDDKSWYDTYNMTGDGEKKKRRERNERERKKIQVLFDQLIRQTVRQSAVQIVMPYLTCTYLTYMSTIMSLRGTTYYQYHQGYSVVVYTS